MIKFRQIGDWDWYLDHIFLIAPAAMYVGSFLKTFKEYPPRMKSGSLSLEDVMDKLTTLGNN